MCFCKRRTWSEKENNVKRILLWIMLYSYYSAFEQCRYAILLWSPPTLFSEALKCFSIAFVDVVYDERERERTVTFFMNTILKGHLFGWIFCQITMHTSVTRQLFCIQSLFWAGWLAHSTSIPIKRYVRFHWNRNSAKCTPVNSISYLVCSLQIFWAIL